MKVTSTEKRQDADEHEHDVVGDRSIVGWNETGCGTGTPSWSARNGTIWFHTLLL